MISEDNVTEDWINDGLIIPIQQENCGLGNPGTDREIVHAFANEEK